MFRTLTYLKPNTYSEPFQRLKMRFFAKIVKNCNSFSKLLHHRSLIGFWICPSLNKYSLICRVTSHYIMYEIYPETYCVTLAYWEHCYIRKFAIFRILANLGPEAYSESCLYRQIQTHSGIFNNDTYNNINFLFFTLILHTFQQILKKHVFWLQWCRFQCLPEST